MQKQWSIEVVTRINEWENGCWDANAVTWKVPRAADWTNKWIKESMNQWSNELNQRTNESVNQRIIAFFRPHPPNVLRSPPFFAMLLWKWSLPTVSCAFFRPLLPKVLHAPEFLKSLKVQTELTLQVDFLLTTFPDRGSWLWNTALLRRLQEPHHPKKHKVSRPGMFSHVNSHTHTRFRTVTFPNYLMMGGWHDDVVDMMAWKLTMTIVRNSEVFKLNFMW